MTTQEVVRIYFIDTSRRIHMSPNKSGIALLRTAVMDSVEQSDETQLWKIKGNFKDRVEHRF